MKSFNTGWVMVSAAMALLTGLSGCARHEVVASDSPMATPRMDDASKAPAPMPETTAAAMPPSAALTATTPTPMEPQASTTSNTYSSTADMGTPMVSANRSDSDQAPARVDRN